MAVMRSARQKDEDMAKLKAEVQNAPGWHRKAQSDEDCNGCEEKRKERAKKQVESKAQKANTEV